MEHAGHSHNPISVNSTGALQSLPPSYATHGEYSGLLLGHIALMTIGWVFILPIVVMLSIARSRFAIPTHCIFLVINAAGLAVGTIYNSLTPDLYENNVHHKMGWAVTWIVTIQAGLGILRTYVGKEQALYTYPMEQYRHIQDMRTPEQYRYSRDSGHGTEPSSPRTSSPNSPHELQNNASSRLIHPEELSEESLQSDKHGLLGNTATDQFLSRVASRFSTTRAMRIGIAIRSMIDRTILLVGFMLLTTGIVTYGGVFHGTAVFGGLAHFIKGGIFFWVGLLALGRSLGSFADLGWAWNAKPSASLVGSRKAAMPSAEFIESLLIFCYGSTNVFLEHLGASGQGWSAGDLEHVSISIMFFGGGLCGMLVESKRIRNLLNSTVMPSAKSHSFNSYIDPAEEPRSYRFSMNPLPGIIILLLGLMMSSHHQMSMVSTMMHKQWGTLFVCAALARGVTYILTYVSPPTSVLPSRPPSEIVAAFCLISGGLIFMGSNSDVVLMMEIYELNAMFMFTVMMGLTAFLMAWTIVVLAVKGWAVQRETESAFAATAAVERA